MSWADKFKAWLGLDDEHSEGLSIKAQAEVTRVNARTQTVLEKAVRMRIDVMRRSK